MAFEDSYKAQLQGVSQQLPKDRLDGQMSQQTNMLSDTVTNLRRRPGLAYATSFRMAAATDQNTAAWSTSIGDLECQVFANSTDGSVRVLSYSAESDTYTSVLDFTDPYLIAASVRDLKTASVGNELFMVNSSKSVQKGPLSGTNSPYRRGFFTVLAGAFNKKYEVTIEVSPDLIRTFAYTTPAGTGAGDADLSTPAYIAAQLTQAIANSPSFGDAASPPGPVTALYDGASVHVNNSAFSGSRVRISTGSGKAFMTTSGLSYLADASDLPATLPQSADGYVMATGSAALPVYYQYVSATSTWLEASEYDTRFETMVDYPISIRRGNAALSEPALLKVNTTFESRFAGDTISNPDPAFLGSYITGIGSYQGRLVLLVGNTVCMSASGKPRRFYRSTVTSLLDNDTIGVSATATSSAEWRQCVEYGKDLLLFSSRYQAVVPGANTAVTPRTAAILLTSKYAGDVLAAPLNTGRTVLFMKPVTEVYFGVMEMISSQYADSTYTSYEATAHLPSYMPGRCAVAAASSVANLAVFMPTNERTALIVHEYTWQGDVKAQQAWHKWTFKFPISSVYFAGSKLHVVFVRNGYVLVATMDPKASTSLTAPVFNAPLDLKFTQPLLAGAGAAPPWVYQFLPDALNDLIACTASGPQAGDRVQVRVDSEQFYTDPNYPGNGVLVGSIVIGFPFMSVVEPTPPMLKDHNGVRVTTNKTTVARFILGTNNTREFQVSVSDEHSTPEEAESYPVGPLTFSSTELDLGEALVGGPYTSTIIPAFTRAESTRLILKSDSTGDMNITSLEYVMKTKEKIQRKKG